MRRPAQSIEDEGDSLAGHEVPARSPTLSLGKSERMGQGAT